MNKDFDITPFPYVGNNKYYTELSKDELDELKAKSVKTEALPASDEVEENCVTSMLPQIGLTSENEEPDVDAVFSDSEEDAEDMMENDDEEANPMQLDDEFYLLKESLYDEVNGVDTYFESAKFIGNLKDKIKSVFTKKNKDTQETKVMTAAKLYTDMRFAAARMKIALAKDPGMKSSLQYRQMQKKLVATEKAYRKAKEGLTTDEIAALTSYNEEFDATFSKKISMQIQDVKDAKKAAETVKKEYADIFEDGIVVTEDAGLAAAAIVSGGLIAYNVVKTKKGTDKINKCIEILKKTDSSFIDPNDMTVKRYKIRDTLNDTEDKNRGKEVNNKLLKKLIGRYIDVYSHNGKEIFSYVVDQDQKVSSGVGVGSGGSVMPTVSVETTPKFYFKMIDSSLSKFKDCYLAFATNKAKYKQIEAWNWAEDFVKNNEGKIKTESCETECGDNELVTEKNIESDMKPIVDALHSKGYKTKAASSGHKNVSIKKDGDKDNIAEDHHYGDARLVFDGKYNLGKAPKYWYWKKAINNADEVEYLDVIQIKKDEWPDNSDKFTAWKAGYMKSLKDWVDGLPNVSNNKSEDVKEEDCKTESTEDIEAGINTLYESVIGNLMFEVLDI